MSQIYNGSFLLGNTSATTLSAGPGIKLDTSVPGVIGISNDETVLFDVSSGKAWKDTITLSESRKNFDSLKLLATCTNSGPCGYIEIPMFGINLTSAFAVQSNNIPYSNLSGSTYTINWLWNITATDNSMTLIKSRFWGKMNFDDATNAGSWQQGVNNSVPTIYKVVGINRISGGN